METIQFIKDSLYQVQFRLMGTFEGLTDEEAQWRPAPYANNIGFILWHMARAEDSSTTIIKGTGETLWVSELWYEIFRQPIDAPDPGDKMGLQQLYIPELKTLLAYSKRSYAQTEQLLDSLVTADLDRQPQPTDPARTVAVRLRHMVTHKNNHHGQIDYIRGLQDQNWDLPPGTGSVLPTSS